MSEFDFPVFRPHPLFRGGHAQTLAGAYLPARRDRHRAQQLRVPLADGDTIVLHDDCPPDWQATDRSALLLHGLGGSHESGYMRRIARKLAARGVRAFRMDLRGCGAGMGLARWPYHSGRSADAAAAIEAVARHLPHSPMTLVGFSLGANIALKLLGECGSSPCGNLDSAMAVCPPVDLAACSRRISERGNRHYDRYFVSLLLRQLSARQIIFPAAASVVWASPPRTLWEFDDTFTAVLGGFGTAERYYREASSAQFIPRIELPTLILASRDDPLIESGPLAQVPLPNAVMLCFTDRGGHLGFIGKGGLDPDRRWMDWRVVDWVLSRGRGVPASDVRSTADARAIGR